MKIDPQTILSKLSGRASELLKDSQRLERLLGATQAKLADKSGALKGLVEDFKTMLRLLQAYVRGTYRLVPWTTLVAAVAAILYFLNPFDLIPDFLVGTGFIDDGAVLAFVFTTIKASLREFTVWEKGEAADTTEAD